jgi:hypothetical protein
MEGYAAFLILANPQLSAIPQCGRFLYVCCGNPYSDATKDSGVFLDVDATQDLGFPESKYRDYFLGSL